MLTLITPSGRVLDGDTALHLMTDLWCRTNTGGAPVVDSGSVQIALTMPQLIRAASILKSR